MRYRPLLIVLGLLLAAYLGWEGVGVAKKAAIAADLSRQVKPYVQLPVSPRLHVLVVGDSTAAGVGASRPEESVAGRLGAFLPTAQITNQSQSGIKLRELARRFADINGPKYDLMVIHIGANDILRLTPYGQIRQQLHQILAEASASARYVVHFTSGNVGEAPFFPWFAKPYFSHRSRVVGDIARAEAAKFSNIFYIDLHQSDVAERWAKEPAKYYAADGLHPGGEGYKDWFETMKMVLQAQTNLFN